MDSQQLSKLLAVNQINDYTWRAILPEITTLWARGYSEEEAIANWLKSYNQLTLAPVFDSILQERAKHPRITIEGAEHQNAIQRPVMVEFPYRGKLYRFATNEGLPKRHLVLPNGTILVVCRWTGRVPSALADVRRGPEPMAPSLIAEALNGSLAEEVPLAPGQTTKAMAILDVEGQRYAVDVGSEALVEFPHGKLYRMHSHYQEEPVRIANIIPFDPADSYMAHQLQRFGKTPAIPVTPDYPGMANEPRDLRIHFRIQGERFVLSHEAYEQRKSIVYVPDHGFYRIGLYLQSLPVQLGDLSPVAIEACQPNSVAAALRYADAGDLVIERFTEMEPSSWPTPLSIPRLILTLFLKKRAVLDEN